MDIPGAWNVARMDKIMVSDGSTQNMNLKFNLNNNLHSGIMHGIKRSWIVRSAFQKYIFIPIKFLFIYLLKLTLE